MKRSFSRPFVCVSILFSFSFLSACQGGSGEEKINVTQASYGLNRRADQAGNARQFLKEACDGKRTCSFPVSDAASKIGDHSPGQTKDFQYVYLCGDKEKQDRVAEEAVGKTAFLTCAN